MSEVGETPILNPENEKEFFGKTRGVYCQLLGVKEMPDSPEKMPDTVFLPSEVLGDLEAAIIEAREDPEIRERSQHINWNEEQREFKKGELFVGIHDGVSGESVRAGVRRYFLGERAMVNFHTHPRGDFKPSADDLNSFRNLGDFIPIIGSDLGIMAFFRMKKALGFSMGWFSGSERRKSGIQKNLETKGIVATSEEMGFTPYIWRPHIEKLRTVLRGDLQKGIILFKMRELTLFMFPSILV